MFSHFLFLTITACFDPKTTQQPSSPRCFQRNHISPFWSFHTSYSLKKLLTSIQTQQWNTKRFTIIILTIQKASASPRRTCSPHPSDLFTLLIPHLTTKNASLWLLHTKLLPPSDFCTKNFSPWHHKHSLSFAPFIRLPKFQELRGRRHEPSGAEI